MLLDCNQALAKLRTVQNKWRQIGKALCVPETHIKQVELQCIDNDTLGMTEMIDFWIKKCGGQSNWRELSNALKTVGEEQLAQQFMDTSETETEIVKEEPLAMNANEIGNNYCMCN